MGFTDQLHTNKKQMDLHWGNSKTDPLQGQQHEHLSVISNFEKKKKMS